MVCYTDTSITLLPCCLRARSLSAATHPRMASLIFSSASSKVSPSEWQPGSAGQLTINPPSSGSGVTTTLNIIIGRLLLSPYCLIMVWKHLTRRECPGREWRTRDPLSFSRVIWNLQMGLHHFQVPEDRRPHWIHLLPRHGTPTTRPRRSGARRQGCRSRRARGRGGRTGR